MGNLLAFGSFRLDPVRRVLWQDGTLQHVAPRALDLLVVLAAAPGQVLTKSELLEKVWPDSFVEEANLSVNVSLLRKAVGKDWIETVARRGYRFKGDVTPEAHTRPGSLAVLPFRVLGGVDAFLGPALADAVACGLLRMGHVVRPMRASTRAAEATSDPREAGKRLAADAVLDGSVVGKGSRIRLSVELISVAGDAPGFSGSFDEEGTDLFAVQDALAMRVAEALGAPPGPASHVPQPAALRAWLQGRVFAGQFTSEGLMRAVGSYREAADADPAWSPPHIGLAQAAILMGFAGLMPAVEAWALAEAETRAALAGGESVAEARTCLAFLRLFRDLDLRGAEEEIERAVAAGPLTADTHAWYALLLGLRGRSKEARQAVLRARAVDPVSFVAWSVDGLLHHLNHVPAAARAAHARSAELEPHHFVAHWGLGLAHVGTGVPFRAVLAHERALELAEGAPFMRAVLARSQALAGQTAEARAALAELGPGLSRYQEATVRVALGEPEAAVAALERAVWDRDPWVVWMGVDPLLDPLRGRPDFETVARPFAPGAPAAG